jgi:hypothetical protein
MKSQRVEDDQKTVGWSSGRFSVVVARPEVKFLERLATAVSRGSVVSDYFNANADGNRLRASFGELRLRRSKFILG